MNQKTTYEQTITSKLDQLAVPDMKESIWARIENELNTDLPDGSDEPPTSPKPTAPRAWRLGKKLSLAGAVIVAAALIYTFVRQPAEPSSAPAPTESRQQTDTVESIISGPQKPETINQTNSAISPPVEPGRQPAEPANSNFTVPPGLLFPVPIPVMPDSIITTPQIILPRLEEKKTDSATKPKSKGVKGISDDDYRINLKKDSVP